MGHRYTVVTAFASPENMTRGGFAAGPDMVVEDSASIGREHANSTWIHEYVHTRQGMDLGPGMEWFVEASAQYYEYRLLYEQGRMSRATFDRVLIGLNQMAREDVVLANQSTWHDNSEYVNGALVLAAIDHDIRRATGGNRTLEDGFRRLNQYRGVGRNDTATYQVYADEVANVSGQRMDSFLSKHVRGSVVPKLGKDVPVKTWEGKAYRYTDGQPLAVGILLLLALILVLVAVFDRD